MKVVFMGTPDFSVPILDALCKEHEVVCVYTRAPKEAGRGQKESKTPVHEFALRQGIEVRTPKTLRNEEEQAAFKALGADVAVVAAYGLILPKPVLEAFPNGCINVHASMLPRWRGAAPIQRAILNGDEFSGVTIMQMDEGLDTGDMLLEDEHPIKITTEVTGEVLHDALSEHGAEMIAKVLRNLDAFSPKKQGEMTTPYAAKIEKQEAKLDFSLTTEEVERKVRAFNPFPGAYFVFNGERFKLLKVTVAKGATDKAGTIQDDGNQMMAIACADGVILVEEIQRQGKKPMPVKEFLRGFTFPVGALAE